MSRQMADETSFSPSSPPSSPPPPLPPPPTAHIPEQCCFSRDATHVYSCTRRKPVACYAQLIPCMQSPTPSLSHATHSLRTLPNQTTIMAMQLWKAPLHQSLPTQRPAMGLPNQPSEMRKLQRLTVGLHCNIFFAGGISSSCILVHSTFGPQHPISRPPAGRRSLALLVQHVTSEALRAHLNA